MNAPLSVPRVLQRVGFRWTPSGVLVTARTQGKTSTVLIPMSNIEIIFQRELAREGVPLPQGVGRPGSVGGFFQRVAVGEAACRPERYTHPAVGRASKAVRAARKKRRVARRKKFFKGVGKAFKKVGQVVKKVVTSKFVRGLVSAVGTVFPVLAPAAVAVNAAAVVIKKIDKGKKLVEGVARGKVKRAPQVDREIIAAARSKRGIGSMAELARRGDPTAKRTMGALSVALAIKNRAAAERARRARR